MATDDLKSLNGKANQDGFWQTKSLSELSKAEWEALCDGCGQCCLVKLEDEETGDLYHTRIACRMLDIGKCRCTDYENRHARVSDCLSIDLESILAIHWLPVTCGYRCVAEGRELAWWHPLISDDPESVHKAGISVRSTAISEVKIAEDDYRNFIFGKR